MDMHVIFYVMLACSYVMPLLLLFFMLIHMHCASHLGMIDESREGCDDRAEPEDGVW